MINLSLECLSSKDQIIIERDMHSYLSKLDGDLPTGDCAVLAIAEALGKYPVDIKNNLDKIMHDSIYKKAPFLQKKMMDETWIRYVTRRVSSIIFNKGYYKFSSSIHGANSSVMNIYLLSIGFSYFDNSKMIYKFLTTILKNEHITYLNKQNPHPFPCFCEDDRIFIVQLVFNDGGHTVAVKHNKIYTSSYFDCNESGLCILEFYT